jgi:uncharacterized peroxidase-related enzyme
MIVRDWRSAPLAARQRALCAYAVKLTCEPVAVERADLQRLLAAGFDERAAHDAVQIAGYFNYVTRVAEGLGLEPETFLPPWGSPAHRHRPPPGPAGAGARDGRT